MLSSLAYHREQARAGLLTKVSARPVAPVQPKRDETLQADTIALYDALALEMGLVEFGRWLMFEFPWLEKPTTPLVRVWWVLQRKYDEVMGLDHRGLSIVTKETVRDV